MRFEDCFKLGKIVKTRGFKGSLTIFIEVGAPKDFKKTESVFVEINNKLIPFFIDQYVIGSKKQVYINFSGIENETQAEDLVNKNLYLPNSFLPKENEELLFMKSLMGFQLIDENLGEIGTVTDFYDIPGNQLLSVQIDEEEILIPFKEPIIQKVDQQEKKIFIQAPDGLIELYKE